MDYQKLMETRDRENPFAAYVGIATTKIEEGCAEVTLRVRPEHLNPVGVVHGGCLYTLADVATGAAGSSFGFHTATVSGEYHYLAPARNVKELIVAAKCVKNGKTIMVFDVEVHSDTGALIGKGVFTSFRLDQEIII